VATGTAGPPSLGFGEASPPGVALVEAGSITGGDIGETAGPPGLVSGGETGGSEGTGDNPGGRGVFGVCVSSGMNDFSYL